MKQRSWSRKTAIGTAMVAGLAVVLMTRPGEPAPSPRANPTTATVIAVAEPGTPRHDYTLDLSTGRTTPLPDEIRVSAAEVGRSPEQTYAASPDGDMLAYVGLGDDENRQIFVARIDGSGVRQVTHDVRAATSPAWSPDGTRVAYVGYGAGWDGNDRHLFVVDVATGVSTRITGESENVSAPQFTPDGSSILYTGGGPSSPGLRAVPVEGGRSTLLLGPGNGLTDAAGGSLSPDGSLLTFVGGGFPESFDGHCGPCRLVANADGSEPRVIFGCWGSNPAGTWSPDGSRIVCSDDMNGIIVVGVARGNASRVAEGRSAIWLDRHTLLVDVA